LLGATTCLKVGHLGQRKVVVAGVVGRTGAHGAVFKADVRAELQAGELLMSGAARRVFIPIAGLHHAARDKTSGFCVFNDIGVLVEDLRRRHGIKRIAYVDIDAHHGDGVYYGFASDPDLIFVDIHEDGRFLFPGTGHREEVGIGPGEGAKLNIPMHPGDGDEEFLAAWEECEAFLEAARPEFYILVAGADSLAGDPLTHLQYSENAHGTAARAICRLADAHAQGRVLGLGAGGYNRRNVGAAWSRVVAEFADSV
jgi:acetoin utilization protein AcuC